MPPYPPVPAPRPRPPVNGLLVAAQALGILRGTLSAVEGDTPTQPPDDEATQPPDQRIDATTRAWHETGGVSFLPYPCSGGGTFDPCSPAAAPLIDPTAYPEGQSVAGFPLKYGVECTALDPFTRDESRSYATVGLNVRQHYLAGREFWRGEQATESGWPNVYLTDASTTETIGVGLSPCGGLALLEEAIAGNAIDVTGGDAGASLCSGAQGIIHASPALAAAWARDYSVVREGNLLFTTAMHTPVISGPGYDGTGPGYPGPEETGDGESWAYATGWLEVRLSPTQLPPLDQSIEKDTNVYTQWAWRLANVAVDSCCVAAVQVDLGECSTESGTG